jgi:2-methylcitrate dehydratase PrpD
VSADRGAAAVARGIAALAEWSAALEWEAIPAPVRQRAGLVLADDLAAMVAARQEPELAALQDGVARSAGAAESTVFNRRGMRLDRYSAALANGAASCWAELDSGYRRAVCHAGIYCLPALLAEAEAEGRPVRELLRALVIGYETVARVARAFAFPNLVLHPHGSLAAIGAAASVAALRRLPADQALGAVSTAATTVHPAPFAHASGGSLARNVWPGLAAQAGLRAADWAPIGISGLPTALHDVYAGALGAQPNPDELTDGLGQGWALADAYHKVFACCQYGHATIEATKRLRERARHDRIAGILIETHWRALTLDNPDPRTTIAGKFSIQHIAATAAVHGQGGFAAFAAAELDRPAVAALRRRVTLAPFEPEPDWPNDRPARVTWALDDGTRLTEEVLSARGGPDLPFTPDEIGAKIRGIVALPYPAMAPRLDAILKLDADILQQSWTEAVAAMTVEQAGAVAAAE